MKRISKKIWFALSFVIVAASAIFACKKHTQKEKSTHVVVDRLINQLVCEFTVRADNNRFPRGVLGINLPKLEMNKRTWKRDRRGGDDITLSSSQKIVTKGRVGKQRNDPPARPIGGDL